MALTLKLLAATSLNGGTDTLLYPTAAASKTALIKNIILTNTGGATATVNIMVAPAGGTKRQISPKNLSIASNAQVVLDSEITISLVATQDSIYGNVTNGPVDCVINGLERDV